MPVDQEKIKKSLDDFESSNYVDSEEELKDQVRKSVRGHLRNKLGLQNNPDGSEVEDGELENQEKEKEPEKEREDELENSNNNDDDGSKE